MVNYNGWNLDDKITLVIKQCNFGDTDYRQAYIVKCGDKKQLRAAVNWGEITKYIPNGNKDEYGKDMYDKKVIAPEILTTENKDFRLTLLSSAKASSQGGKLSFWNCLIEKIGLNIKVVVGINSDLLIDVLLQNTFKNGKCDNSFSFARKEGAVGLLSKNMKEYKEALTDMATKESKSKGKTTKWKLGHSYETLTLSEVYLGEMYCPILLEEHINWSCSSFRGNQRTIILKKNTDTKRYAKVYTDKVSKFKSLREYLNWLNDLANKRYEDKTGTANHIMTLYDDFIVSFDGNLITKLPARTEGDFILNIDVDDYKSSIHSELNNMKVLMLKSIKEKHKNITLRAVNGLFTDVYKRTYDDITPVEKEIFGYMFTENNLKQLYGLKDEVKIYTKIGEEMLPGVHLKALLS